MFRFLDLPPELRTQIYLLLVPAREEAWETVMSLLLVNKQLHREASACLRREARVLVSCFGGALERMLPERKSPRNPKASERAALQQACFNNMLSYEHLNVNIALAAFKRKSRSCENVAIRLFDYMDILAAGGRRWHSLTVWVYDGCYSLQRESKPSKRVLKYLVRESAVFQNAGFAIVNKAACPLLEETTDWVSHAEFVKNVRAHYKEHGMELVG